MFIPIKVADTRILLKRALPYNAVFNVPTILDEWDFPLGFLILNSGQKWRFESVAKRLNFEAEKSRPSKIPDNIFICFGIYKQPKINRHN